MITEPLADKQRRPLQDVQTLYIGDGELAARVVGFDPGTGAKSTHFAMRRELSELTHHDGSYRLSVGSKRNNHGVK
ncbi:hypothetical protein D4Q71_06340 [Rhodopseudomonas palustris]|nr:hypothetical protein B1S06_10770 [Rhodopseudomonas palustris]PPQ45229.1 hypothetical protein CKO39_00565 [Rhodopseudomonas palustris]RIA02226.1 hypothetical protein D1920_08625 [Rhodopseudomonas palustris]RJF66436.1 hypothetical protein D4Q71_06340 [Rhodopseudomonas palustris]